MNTGRIFLSGCGTQTAALGFGGYPPPGALANTELWNGTNWTEVNDLNTARQRFAGAGTNTAALAFGGQPSFTAVTETWNGTNWTEVGDLNTGRRYLAGAGTNTDGLAFGGDTSSLTAVTEEFTAGPATITFDVS